jgi:hypothetical protein
VRVATALLALAMLAPFARAQVAESAPSPSGGPAEWFRGIMVNGFVSTGFTYNANRPDTGLNAYRVFDGAHNSFTIDVLELCVRRDVVKPGDAGFRIDLAAGASIPRVTRSAGMSGGDVDVQQMVVSWMAPIGSGLRIDLGKFVTPFGYEVIEGFDGFNDNYTRSFLFGYAIPFTHTGLRAAYAFSPSLSLTALVVNGWDDAVDNNRSKSVGGSLAVSPLAGLTATVTGMVGPEQPGNNSGNRTLVDACASYAAGGGLTFGVNADYGRERLPAGGDVVWSGFAGYLRCAISDRFAIALRGERFEDGDGARTGVAQTLSEFTLTPEYRPVPGIVLRADLRYDMSDQPVFQKAATFTDSQATVGLNALVTF